MLIKSFIRDKIPFLIKLFIFSGISALSITICAMVMWRYGLHMGGILGLKQWVSSVCWYVIGFNFFVGGLPYYLNSEYIYERRSKKG